MPMSNAERQRRHRERVKARLSAAQETAEPTQAPASPDVETIRQAAHDEWHSLVVAHYHKAGAELLTATGDPVRTRAAKRFLAAPVLAVDVIEWAEHMGRERAVAIYKAMATEAMGAAVPAPANGLGCQATRQTAPLST